MPVKGRRGGENSKKFGTLIYNLWSGHKMTMKSTCLTSSWNKIPNFFLKFQKDINKNMAVFVGVM